MMEARRLVQMQYREATLVWTDTTPHRWRVDTPRIACHHVRTREVSALGNLSFLLV